MNPEEAILFIIFAGATAMNMAYWIFLFSKLAFYEKNESEREVVPPANNPNVSLIICARNEAENLQKNLNRFVTQTYRSLEIIIVDDQSTDQTPEILENFQKSCHTFRIIIISNVKKFPGKKDALERGIQRASGELILVTDADCQPLSDRWVEKMVEKVQGKKEIVLGYSPYKKEKGWLNRFIRFETVYSAIQFFSFALAGMPYMGVGRNMMYKRSLFEKSKGFSSHKNIASGDDDLFINEVADSVNTAICLDENSFVISEPLKTWKQYYTQKMRHLTTARHYRPKHKWALGILSGTHAVHYMGGIVLAYMKVSTIFVFLLFVLRMSIVVFIYAGILEKLRAKSLLKWVPVLDFCLFIYYLVFSPGLIKRKTTKWK